jgi:hypothetical protein
LFIPLLAFFMLYMSRLEKVFALTGLNVDGEGSRAAADRFVGRQTRERAPSPPAMKVLEDLTVQHDKKTGK